MNVLCNQTVFYTYNFKLIYELHKKKGTNKIHEK